jgi:hypothetical protein
LKIAVIVDRMELPRWAALALARLSPGVELTVYNCTNTPPTRKRLQHAVYYLLNLVTVRNPLTQPTPIGKVPGVRGTVQFESEMEGAWQRLPEAILRRIAEQRPAAIIKLGMGLLRVPSSAELRVPILSYHHGDPQQFRGRPAGFYEVLQGQGAMGQIIQILSNKLDAGRVVAFAETKVHGHSYRATLMESYRHSPLLLPKALAAVVAGATLPHQPTGHNYRLPANGMALRFLLLLAGRTVRRLAYGLLFEKKWQVSTAPAPARVSTPMLFGAFPPKNHWATLPVPKGYNFLADPFFAPDGDGLLVEALNRKTRHGELLRISDGLTHKLAAAEFHQSYPATISVEGRHYLVPEMSEGSSQRLFRLEGGTARDAGPLRVFHNPRLLDPTLWAQQGRIYLFANDAAEGAGVLRLWSSLSLDAEFQPHPANPILISPCGARMAGNLMLVDGDLVRLGQDLRRGYGDGLVLHKVLDLTPESYGESVIGTLRFRNVRGPHTLQLRDGTFAFDWYSDRFSLFAGARRLKMSRPRPSAPTLP